MIYQSRLNAVPERSIRKNIGKIFRIKKPGKYYSKVLELQQELQQSITAENYTKKTEDRIYRGLPFFHCYYSSYSSSSDSSPSLSSPEEFSLLSS